MTVKFVPYAIARLGHAPAELRPARCAGRSLCWLKVEDLALAYAVCSAEPAGFSLVEAVAHARVIEVLHQAQTVLPLRFGQAASSVAELTRLAGRDLERYRAVLAQVHDCHEFGVRLWPRTAATTVKNRRHQALSAGTAYMLRRREEITTLARQQREIVQAAQAVVASLEGLYRQVQKQETVCQGQCALALQFLVPRARAARFRVHLEALPSFAAAALQTYGPGPIYHFCQICQSVPSGSGIIPA